MMIKFIIFNSFLIASVFAAENTIKPIVGVLDLQPNFEYGQVKNEFRVHYSGLGAGIQGASFATIKIYKIGQSNSPVIQYEINDPTKGDVFYFVDKDAEAANYEVEICDDQSRCSERNPALKGFSGEVGKVTCSKGTKKSDGEWVHQETLEIKMIGANNGDWLDEKKIKDVERELQGRFTSDWTKHGVAQNPSYTNKDGKGVFYVGLLFNLRHFRDMFKKRGQDETQTHVEEFCERKYLLTANAHMVKKGKSKIEHRFKTTLFMSEGGKHYFIHSTGDEADKRLVPVEITQENVDISSGTYTVYVSFCATEKDVNESTFCSDAITTELTVQ